MRISDAALALSLAVATTFQARAPESPAHRSAVARIREVLLDPSTATDARAARLAQAGPPIIPALLELLASGVLPGSEDGQPTYGAQEDAAIAALARFRRGEIGTKIDPLLEPAARPGARRAAIRLLGSVGERTDLARLCDALRGPDPDSDPDSENARLFRTSVASILARDEQALTEVRALFRKATPALRFHLIGALGQTGSGEALAILVGELSARSEETGCILAECAKLAAVVALPVDESIASAFRLRLHSDDASEVRSSAECLGGIQDAESVYDLTLLLGNPQPDVTSAALDALRSITGASFRPDPERWRSALLAEAEWHAESLPRLTTTLGGTNSLDKMAAIQELAAHPQYRAETALLIERSIRGEAAALVAAACSALRQMGAATAVPFLEECAADASPEVSAEARTALEAIRSRRAPPRNAVPGAPQAQAGPDR